MRLRSARDRGGSGGLAGFWRGAAAFENEFVDGGDVVPGQSFALVFAPEDVAEGFEVLEGGRVEVCPRGFGFEFGLEAPAPAEAFGAGFPFFAVFGDGFPDVNIAHGPSLPAAGRARHRKDAGAAENEGRGTAVLSERRRVRG